MKKQKRIEKLKTLKAQKKLIEKRKQHEREAKDQNEIDQKIKQEELDVVNSKIDDLNEKYLLLTGNFFL